MRFSCFALEIDWIGCLIFYWSFSNEKNIQEISAPYNLFYVTFFTNQEMCEKLLLSKMYSFFSLIFIDFNIFNTPQSVVPHNVRASYVVLLSFNEKNSGLNCGISWYLIIDLIAIIAVIWPLEKDRNSR